MRNCSNCRNGIRQQDGETVYVLCANEPPKPVMTTMPDPKVPGGTQFGVAWLRPAMKPNGWCGQFKFSFRTFFGYGARA